MARILEGILEPTGRIKLTNGKMPDHPVKIKMTVLEETMQLLDEIGDYLPQLENYENLLAKGKIRWK